MAHFSVNIDSANTLGTEVRRKRKSLKLTLEQTALVSGVSMSFLRSLERGKETCHLAPTFKVLNALGMSLDLQGTTSPDMQYPSSKPRTIQKERL